jgi:GR25 family glycosyltransferase involved in LPS biosynthesis
MNKAINTVNEQLTEMANEVITDLIHNLPDEEKAELKTAEDVEDWICDEGRDGLYDAFYYFHTYYAETAALGNSYEVACIFREAIEQELGCFDFDFDTDEDAIHMTANKMVNIYAELMGANMVTLDGDELLAVIKD